MDALTDTRVISITHPNDQANLSGWEDVVRFEFDDITIQTCGYVMFDLDMAIKMVDSVMNTDKQILVHCDAGMSRSAAVCRFFVEHKKLTYRDYPGNIGTWSLYNKHVYATLRASCGDDLVSYYSALEHEQRMMEKWR